MKKMVKFQTKLDGTKLLFNIVESEQYKSFQEVVKRRLEVLTPVDGTVNKYNDGNVTVYHIYNEWGELTYIFTTAIILRDYVLEFKMGRVIEVG